MKVIYTGSYLYTSSEKSEWRIVAAGISKDAVMREARHALRGHLKSKGTVGEDMIQALVDEIGARTRLSVVKYVEPKEGDHIHSDWHPQAEKPQPRVVRSIDREEVHTAFGMLFDDLDAMEGLDRNDDGSYSYQGWVASGEVSTWQGANKYMSMSKNDYVIRSLGIDITHIETVRDDYFLRGERNLYVSFTCDKPIH